MLNLIKNVPVAHLPFRFVWEIALINGDKANDERFWWLANLNKFSANVIVVRRIAMCRQTTTRVVTY